MDAVVLGCFYARIECGVCTVCAFRETQTVSMFCAGIHPYLLNDEVPVLLASLSGSKRKTPLPLSGIFNVSMKDAKVVIG